MWSLLALSAAGLTAAAGVIHFVASTLPDHHSHPLLLSFFLATGVGQVVWGLAVARGGSPRLLMAGAALNLGIAGVWVVSRTVGIPFVNGGQPETAGFGDVASTMFEVVAAGGVALAVALPAEAAGAVVRRGSALFGTAMAATLGMLLASVVTLPGGMDPAGPMTPTAMTTGRPGGEAMSPAGMAQVRMLGQPISVGMQVMSGAGGARGSMPGMSGGGAQPMSGAGMAMGGAPGGTAPALPPMDFWGQRTTVRYGPIPLPPTQLGGGLHNLVSPAFPKPCNNCLITGIIPDMVYADGSAANIDSGVMLHHVVLFDNSRDDYTCPRWDGVGALGRRLFASGNERTAMSLPAGFGLPVGSEQWAGLFDLMNMSSQTRSVYLQFTVFHVPAGSQGIRPVVPLWLDENNCSNSEFSVPAGRSDTTWNWASNVTGRVVLVGGHVHDGGVSITATNTTLGERLCTAVASYGTKPHYDGNIDSMSPVCRWDRLGVIRDGDNLRLDAIYDTPKPLSGVMGIMLLFVYPTNDLAGGTPPPPGANGPANYSGSGGGGMNMQGMS